MNDKQLYSRAKLVMRRMRRLPDGDVVFSKRLILHLVPWNNEMLRVIEPGWRGYPDIRKIISKFRGTKISAKKLLQIFERSVLYEKLATHENRKHRH